jgi:hypothetical protein
MLLELEHGTQLGPARVVRAAGPRVQIERPDEIVWAVSALAFPYEFVAGDEVLAIGQGRSWYVIGLLRGSGKTSFTAPGDLELRAPRGKIDLISGEGVRIQSPDVAITAKRLELAANTVFERFVSATRWIKDAWQLRAGRIRTRVDATYDLKAERIVERAEADVKIDGQKIHLG